MRELCLACAGFALEFIVFYAAGIVLVRILKVKGDCSLTFILGYLVYFAVFELVIVPMTLKWVSLTAAAYIWAGIMSLVLLAIDHIYFKLTVFHHVSGYLRSCDLHNKKTTENTCRTDGSM